MRTETASHAGERTVTIDTDGRVDVARWLALGCVLVLTASYVSVLYGVTQVVGGSRSLLAIVGLSLAAATVLAGLIRPRTAAMVAAVGAGIGFAYYFTSAGVELGTVLTATDQLVSDTVALATGLPLLRMVQAGTWTLGFAPAPVFLSWYLAARGRYAASVVPGGAALGFLVLTGDAGTPAALAGTLAAIGAVAFGDLRHRGGSIAQADLLAVLFAVTVALSLSVSVVPGEPTGPTHLTQGEPGTLEATIDSAPQRSGISGQVDLSPEVRFTVESDGPAYWRTGVYDRFTGDEWVRTGQDRRYDGQLASPPDSTETVKQTVTAETELGIMPVAPQPVELGGEIARRTTVSRHGQPRPETPLQPGESYTVESAVVDPSPAALRAAGTDYPDGITDTYLQTPEDTSSAFGGRTDEITAGADTPYDKAVAIEDALESTKRYSLEVSQPSGNVAEKFLLEMDAGYCVYFATTMTQMLREEGVPARYVTGYTTGQQIDDDTYVVRGLDAHSWVEVYFPDHGWVRFDPTPSSTRSDVHTDRLQEARANGNDDADTDESADVPIDGNDPGTDEEPRDGDGSDPFDGNGTEPNDPSDVQEPQNDTEPENNATNDTDDPETSFNGTTVDGGDARSWLERPSAIARESVALGVVALVGLAAGARRTGALARLRREIGVYWHGPRRDPDRDAERAFERLERLLARQYRPRRRSESARAYLTALAAAAAECEPPTDPRLERVLEAYERATYGGGVDRAEADAAIAVVDDLARDRLPVIGRRE
ncbi:transglutaminase domain-containing protein [Natrinema thermotolerans DSM 11552]|nr:transglutaminase domain-containing protein [Natrinema thermotolerans DSM 11552]